MYIQVSYVDGKLVFWTESNSLGDAKDIQSVSNFLGLTHWDFIETVPHQAWLPTQGNTFIPSTGKPYIPKGKQDQFRIAPYNLKIGSLSIYCLEVMIKNYQIRGNKGQRFRFGSSVIWLGKLLNLAIDAMIMGTYAPSLRRQSEVVTLVQHADAAEASVTLPDKPLSTNTQDRQSKLSIGQDTLPAETKTPAPPRRGHLTWEAVWKPTTDEYVDNTLAVLAAEMPGSFRCITAAKSGEPIASPYLVTLHAFTLILNGLFEKTTFRDNDHDDVQDSWLAALKAQNNRVHWKKQADLEDLEKALNDWSAKVHHSRINTYQLCLRLSDPESEGEPWILEYLLQSAEDPGALINYQDIWIKDSPEFLEITKSNRYPLQLALSLLLQASVIYPPIRAAMQTARPCRMELTDEQVVEFLLQDAERLTVSGFPVILPIWWNDDHKLASVNLNLKVKSPLMKSAGKLSFNRVVEFDFEACIGDQEISREELMRLAKQKTPLLKLKGMWTFVDPELIAEALKYIQKHKNHTMTVGDFIKLAIGAKTVPVSISHISAEGWAKKLYEGLVNKRDFDILKQPKRFEGALRHYQVDGFSWLDFLQSNGFGACLADDMGLGKTIQALALLQKNKNAGEKQPVLLICPVTVINNWLREAHKFTPHLKVMVHHGYDRIKSAEFVSEAGKHSMVISSYGLVARDAHLLSQVEWSGIILDEAQNIKNPITQQTRAVKAIKAGFRIAMTGTPMENHVGDLWSIMDFLNPGILGSQSAFKERFHKPITQDNDAAKAELLRNITSPFILRRLKTDKTIIADLPDKIETKEYCTLTKEQIGLYQAVADDAGNQIEQASGIQRRGIVLSIITKLKQVCNHPAHFFGDNSVLAGRSGKLQRLIDITEEILENHERVLVFTQYAEMGKLLQKALSNYFHQEVLFLYGSTPKKKRDEMVNSFQTDPSAPAILVLSLKAGGTGLNLTKANHVIHYDRWWNPAVENQATDRVYRIGQNNNVQVHKFIVAGTLEEKIDEIIDSKLKMADQVIGTGEKWLSELSDDEFKTLISLSDDSWGE